MNYKIIGVFFIFGSLSFCTVKSNNTYIRDVENEMITGMSALSNFFKEFEKTVLEYKSQADGSSNNSSHSVDSSCFTSNSLTFLKDLNERFVIREVTPQIKIKIEKARDYIGLCLQQKTRNGDSKDITELCLHKASLRSVLAKSKASKILGHVGQNDGDSINCSLFITTIPRQTQQEQNIGERTSIISPTKGTAVMPKYEKQNTFPSGSWFACGIALGIFISTIFFVFFWLNKARTQREINRVRREASKDRNAKVSSVYKDIDEYELIPVYRDPVLNNRFTKPSIATPKPETLEIQTEPNRPEVPDHDHGTDTTEKKQFDGYSFLALERDPDYHILEEQDSTIEVKTIAEDQPYFLLESNSVGDTSLGMADEPDNETESHHEEKENIESDLVQPETKETIATIYM